MKSHYRKLIFNIRRVCMAIGIASVALWVVWQTSAMSNQFGYPMYHGFIQNAYVETQAPNIVTAIYLHYRYYDTLFEALMLLFSVIAVIYLSIHDDH